MLIRNYTTFIRRLSVLKKARLTFSPFFPQNITSTYHILFMLGQLYLMKDIQKLHECMKEFELKRVVRLFEATKQRATKAVRLPFHFPSLLCPSPPTPPPPPTPCLVSGIPKLNSKSRC
jgi:hypothetical protein